MNKKFSVLFIVSLFFAEFSCFASVTDNLIRRGSGAITQLAQGNSQGALDETVPYRSYGNFIPITKQTSLNAGLGGVYLRQGLIPFSNLNTRYLNFGANYNVGSNFSFSRLPSLSQNVQMSAGNPYFSNTTTVTPRLGRRWS